MQGDFFYIEYIIQRYKSLFNEFYELVLDDGTIKKGFERKVYFILDELLKDFGVEVKIVDDVIIQNYGILKNSIDDLIEKKRTQMILDSQKPGYEEAKNNEAEVTRSYCRTEQQLIERKKALKAAKKEWSQEKIKNVKEEITALQENHKRQEDLLKKYIFLIGQYEWNLKLLHTGKYQQLSFATWDYFRQYKSKSEVEKAMLLELIELTKVNLKVVKEFREQTGSDIFNNQIENKKKLLVSLEERLENYDVTTSGKSQKTNPIWVKSLNEQLAKVDQKKEDFNKAGQDSVSSFSKGIEISEEKPRKVMSDVATKAIEEIKKKEPEAKQAGEQIVEGLKTGIEKKAGEVTQTVTNMAKEAMSGFRRELGIASPSKVFKEYGKYIDEGLAIGIEDNKDKVIKVISGVSDDMLKKASEIDLEDLGRRLMSSIHDVNKKMQKIQSFKTNQIITRQINSKNIAETAETIAEIKEIMLKQQNMLQNQQNLLQKVYNITNNNYNIFGPNVSDLGGVDINE